jgi:hypothetical protein
MTLQNRETIRDTLAALIEASVVDELEVAEEVTSTKIVDPEGRGPLVSVLSAGSDRPPFTARGSRTVVYLEIQIWTPYGEEFTSAQAEDRADRLELAVAQVLEANRVNKPTWTDIAYSGKSTVTDVEVQSGNLYIFELIPVEVSVL